MKVSEISLQFFGGYSKGKRKYSNAANSFKRKQCWCYPLKTVMNII